jgi:hypothetical protein
VRDRPLNGANASYGAFISRPFTAKQANGQMGRTAASECGSGAPRWIRARGLLDPTYLIFIEERGVISNMMRL